MSISEEQRALAAQQIAEQRALVDFDVVEYTAERIASKYSKGEIVVPEYRRASVWEESRQVKFVESMLLGLPVPFLFVADVDEDLEVIDGAQRIRTIRAFLENELVLKGLEILRRLNDFTFADLPAAEQRRFKNRTVRVVTLSRKADPATRFEVFQRINAGSKTPS